MSKYIIRQPGIVVKEQYRTTRAQMKASFDDGKGQAEQAILLRLDQPLQLITEGEAFCRSQRQQIEGFLQWPAGLGTAALHPAQAPWTTDVIADQPERFSGHDQLPA